MRGSPNMRDPVDHEVRELEEVGGRAETVHPQVLQFELFEEGDAEAGQQPEEHGAGHEQQQRQAQPREPRVAEVAEDHGGGEAAKRERERPPEQEEVARWGQLLSGGGSRGRKHSAARPAEPQQHAAGHQRHRPQAAEGVRVERCGARAVDVAHAGRRVQENDREHQRHRPQRTEGVLRAPDAPLRPNGRPEQAREHVDARGHDEALRRRVQVVQKQRLRVVRLPRAQEHAAHRRQQAGHGDLGGALREARDHQQRAPQAVQRVDTVVEQLAEGRARAGLARLLAVDVVHRLVEQKRETHVQIHEARHRRVQIAAVLEHKNQQVAQQDRADANERDHVRRQPRRHVSGAPRPERVQHILGQQAPVNAVVLILPQVRKALVRQQPCVLAQHPLLRFEKGVH